MGSQSKYFAFAATLLSFFLLVQSIQAQAISIHDCQGLLRQRTLVEAGETRDVVIGVSGVAEQGAVLRLRSIDTGTDFVQTAYGSSVTFPEVPAGNYLLLSDASGVLLGSIDVFGGGATIFGSNAGLVLGGGALLVGTGFIVNNQIDKRDSGSDSEDASNGNVDDCNCDPNASPEALSPEEFFRAQRRYQLNNTFNTRATSTNPFSRRLWLSSVERFWWKGGEETRSSTAARRGLGSELPVVLSSGSSPQGAPEVGVFGQLAQLPGGGMLYLTGAASSTRSVGRRAAPDESGSERLVSLQFRQPLADHVAILGGAALLQFEDSFSSDSTNLRQSLTALEAQISQGDQLRLFVSEFGSTETNDFRSVGIIASHSISPSEELQFLGRTTWEQSQSVAFEVLWSALLP